MIQKNGDEAMHVEWYIVVFMPSSLLSRELEVILYLFEGRLDPWNSRCTKQDTDSWYLYNWGFFICI